MLKCLRIDGNLYSTNGLKGTEHDICIRWYKNVAHALRKIRLIKCLKQIKLQSLLITCAPNSELQSNLQVLLRVPNFFSS